MKSRSRTEGQPRRCEAVTGSVCRRLPLTRPPVPTTQSLAHTEERCCGQHVGGRKAELRPGAGERTEEGPSPGRRPWRGDAGGGRGARKDSAAKAAQARTRETGKGQRGSHTADLNTTPGLTRGQNPPGEARPLTRQARLGLRGEHQPLRQRALPGRVRGGLGLGLGRARGSGLSPQFRRMGWARCCAEGRGGLGSRSTGGSLRGLKRGCCRCNR